MYTDKYWKRRSRKSKPFKQRATFHFAFMMTLLTVCAVNYIVVYGLGAQSEQLPIWLITPAYLLACYLGGRLLLNSKVPWVSFVGTSLIGLPLGFVTYGFIGGEVSLFLMQVLLTTTLSVFVTGIFQVLSCQLNVPKWLPIAFTLGSAMFINVAFTANLRDTPIMNWLVVLFVNARIGYTWGEARAVTPSIDNAIDGVGVLLLESLNPLYYYESSKAL